MIISSLFSKGHKLNIMQIWIKNNKELPFKVRRESWGPCSWIEVTKVLISEHNEEYFKKTGNLYGKAFGKFLGKEPEQQINCAGCYQWILVN